MSGAAVFLSHDRPSGFKKSSKTPKLGSFLLLAYRPPCLAAVTDASRQPRGNEQSEQPLREESNAWIHGR